MGSVVTQLKKISWDKPGVIDLEISNTMLYSELKDDFQPNPKEFTPFHAVAVGRSIVRDGNIAIVTWRFVLGKSIERSDTDRSPGDAHMEQWSMQTTLGEEDLTRHPDIMSILKKYSGYISRDKVRFNRYLPSTEGAAPKKNPWYGTRSYFVPSVELTLERPRQAGRISFDSIKGVGHLDSPPRSGFNFTGKCSWIVVKNSYTKESGKCVELKTWKSGGRLGWTDAVYDPNFRIGPPNAIKDVKVGMREYKEAKAKEFSFQAAVKT
jgi:hypothetical protein